MTWLLRTEAEVIASVGALLALAPALAWAPKRHALTAVLGALVVVLAVGAALLAEENQA